MWLLSDFTFPPPTEQRYWLLITWQMTWKRDKDGARVRRKSHFSNRILKMTCYHSYHWIISRICWWGYKEAGIMEVLLEAPSYIPVMHQWWVPPACPVFIHLRKHTLTLSTPLNPLQVPSVLQAICQCHCSHFYLFFKESPSLPNFVHLILPHYLDFTIISLFSTFLYSRLNPKNRVTK